MPKKPALKTPKKKKEIVAPEPEGKVKPQGKMESVEQGLKKIEETIKQVLTIPVVAAYLKRGCRISEIARVCEVSPQAVDQFIKRHLQELGPLIDKDDSLISMKAKHLHDRAMSKLIEHVENAGPKDLMALNVVSGTHFDKYRLSTNRSTQNISIGHRFMHLQDEMEVIEITDESG